MLKDAIRSLAMSKEKMSLAMGGQLQFAGVSMAEQKALLGELNKKEGKKDGYSFMWS